MDLSLIRSLFDLSLVILILMVQLIIYPAFEYYSKNNLQTWHRQYTKRIAFIVIPLMVGQLILTMIYLLDRTSLHDIAVSLLVLAVWLITFLYFVPSHRKIDEGNHNETLLRQMLRINWWRTTIWIVIFLMNFLEVTMD